MLKICTAFLVLIIFTQNAANATDVVKAGDLIISSAWSRASTDIKRPSAVYLSITNTSSVRDRLIAAHTPTAKRAELHRHFIDNGVMKMRQVKAMEVSTGGMSMLKPGGFHIMLFDLKSFLNEGDMFPVNLTFEKAGEVTIKVHVTGVGSSKAHKKGIKNSQNMKSMDHKKHGSAKVQ